MLKSYNEAIKDNNGIAKAYSIKIGNNVPHRGVNLAYVESDGISPKKNIALSSYSTSDSTTYIEKIMVPDNTMRLTCNDGDDLLPSDEIIMTDEFSIPEVLIEVPKPLYYMSVLSNKIKLEKGSLVEYPGGYATNTIDKYMSTPTDIDAVDKFIYVGKKITLKYANGAPIKSKYKIIIEKDNIVNGMVYIYTEAQETGVYVTYESINGRKTEIINPYTFFSPDNDLESHLYSNGTLANISNFSQRANEHKYTIRLEGDKYAVYVPTQVLLANDNTRHSYSFRYRVEANKRLRHDISQPGTINVGIVSINPTEDENALISMAAIYSQSSKKPSFISFDNPHPPIEAIGVPNAKAQPEYWMANLDMPEEYYYDYDVLIISGMGATSLSRYNSVLHSFLQTGGSLWIDNYGDGVDALVLETNISENSDPFIIGVDFDQIVSTPIQKKILKDELDILSRYHEIKEDALGILQLGYKDVSPKMTLASTENVSDWKTIAKYGEQNDTPALMYKRMFTRGLVVVSNCGIMMGILAARTNSYDHKLAVNIITVLGEDKWYTTPWLYDYVLHKDQVFDGEYGIKVGQYILDHRPNSVDPTDRVAMKKLASSADSALSAYYNIRTAVKEEKYFFHVEEIKDGEYEYKEGSIETMEAKKVELTSKNSPLLVYTTTSHGHPFNPKELGYKDGDIKLIDTPVNFSLCVFSYTYLWSPTTKNFDKLPGKTKDIGYDPETRTASLQIKKSEGLKKIIDLAPNTPGVPSGTEWSGRDDVFFGVLIGNSDTRGQSTFSIIDKPITVIIQNTKTGKIYTNAFGDPCISYEELFDEENRGNIGVYVSTSYQGLMAAKRMFSIKSLRSAPIYALLPDEIDEKEQWFVRVANGIHTVTNYNVSYQPKYVYEVNDFHDQLFLPNEPFRQVIGESPVYLDYNKIQVGRTPMFVQDMVSENQKLVPIGLNEYQSPTFMDWDIEYPVSVSIVSYADPYNPAAVLQQNYTVNYEKGIITLDPQITLTENEFVVASFKHKNLSVSKIQYSNSSVKRSQLSVMSIERDKTVYKIHTNSFDVRLYTITAGVETDITVPFDLDQDDGVIIIHQVMTTPVYADYKYFEIYPIRISGVDVNNGIIYTIDEIKLTDKIEVNYYYEEKFFDYKGYHDGTHFINLDLNPSLGHQITDVKYVNGAKTVSKVPSISMLNKPAYVYMVPSYTTTEYIAKIPTGVVTFNADGSITTKLSTSNETIPNGAEFIGERTFANIIESKTLISRLVFSGAPLNIPELGSDSIIAAAIQKFNSPTAVTKTLSDNECVMPIRGIVQNYNETDYDYVACYIYNKSNIRHTFSREELLKSIANNNAILLAEISVKPHIKPEESVVMDARVRGGGLVEKLTKDKIAQLFPAAINFWDIGEWDGMPYQKNGIAIISLPAAVKNTYSEEQVREIVDKYIACGIEYIIEYR